jgi:hypothetical protein
VARPGATAWNSDYTETVAQAAKTAGCHARPWAMFGRGFRDFNFNSCRKRLKKREFAIARRI